MYSDIIFIFDIGRDLPSSSAGWLYDPRTYLSVASILFSCFIFYRQYVSRQQDNDKSVSDTFWFQKIIAEPYIADFELFFTKWSGSNHLDPVFDSKTFTADLNAIIDRSMCLSIFDASYPIKFQEIFEKFEEDLEGQSPEVYITLKKCFYSELLATHKEVNLNSMKR